MRKALRMIIVLCMACMICMSGLCMAKFIKDDDGNWVEFYREDEKPWNIYFVDTNAIKVCEYEGKKYLDVSIRRKENTVENYVYYIHQTEVTNAKFHRLLDIENRKKHNIEWQNKYAKQKRGTADISEIKNGKSFTPWDEKLVTWVEQNYPAVINEIRTFNHSGQSAGTTNVTGAANATGDMTPPQYDITDSGVVKYTMRADTHDSVKAWTSPGGPDYYIVKMSDSLRAKKSEWEYTRPGDYIIAYWKYPHQQYVKHTGDTWEFSEEYNPEEEQDKELRVYKTFSYDPATDMFTFYSGDFNEMRMRVIDRNTIYVEDLLVKEGGQPENWKAEWTAVFNYVDYNSLTKPHKEYADFHNILVYMDDGIWFPDHKCEMAGSTCYQNLFSACVDMALAFKAVKGQIGELPDGYEFTEW